MQGISKDIPLVDGCRYKISVPLLQNGFLSRFYQVEGADLQSVIDRDIERDLAQRLALVCLHPEMEPYLSHVSWVNGSMMVTQPGRTSIYNYQTNKMAWSMDCGDYDLFGEAAFSPWGRQLYPLDVDFLHAEEMPQEILGPWDKQMASKDIHLCQWNDFQDYYYDEHGVRHEKEQWMYSESDDSEDEEESSEEEIQAQGRSKIKREQAYRRTFTKAEKQKGVYEFGRHLDMKDPAAASDYLYYLGQWLNNLHLPAEKQKFLDLVRNWGSKTKPHRRIAIQLLAMKGHRRAKMFHNVFKGRLNFDYEAWLAEKEPIEAQSLEILLGLGGLLVFLLWMYKEPLEQAASAVGTAKKVIDVTEKVISSFKEMCTVVWQWFKEACRRIKSAFNFLKEKVGVIFKGFLKVVTSLVTFEYIRTLFPENFERLKAWLGMKLGLQTTDLHRDEGISAQAGGERNMLETIMDYLRVNFVKIDRKTFWSYMMRLPKIVSVANAVLWIYEHIENVFYIFLEMWTGEPHGRTKFERDVQAFVKAVEDFQFHTKHDSNEELFAIASSVAMLSLENERSRLEKKIREKKRDIRPHFSGLYLAAVARLASAMQEFKNRRMSAKPRPLPIWVYISGEPGVGKTKAMERLGPLIWRYVRDHSDILGKDEPFHSGHVFTVNQMEEYGDGYAEQFYAYVDDFLQMEDPQARAKFAMNMMTWIAPTPCVMRVADLNQKGSKFFTTRCIISTTNLKPINESRGAAPRAFHGQNLGLVSPAALESRRAISVKMIESSDFDLFALEPGYTCDFGEVITLDNLVAVVGEMIIQADREMKQPFVSYSIPKYEGGYAGGRVVRRPQKDQEGREREQKGKEKEDDGQPGPIESIKAQGSEDDQLEDEWKRPVNPATWNLFSKKNDCKIFSRLPKAVWLGLGPSYLPPPPWQGQEYKMRRKKLIKQVTKKANDNMTDSAQGLLRDCLIWLGPEEFTFVGWMASLKEENRQLFYPEGDPFDYEAWRPLVDQMEQYYTPVLGQPEYEGQEKFFMYVSRVRSSIVLVIAQNVVMGVVAYIVVKKILSLIFPKTAYEAQSGYEPLQRQTTARSRSHRATTRANARINRLATAQGSGLEDLRRIIVGNDDIVEVRLGPKGCSWSDVENNPPVSWSHVLFVYGRCALVPMHTILMHDPENQEVFVSLVKQTKEHCKLSQVEYMGVCHGDIGLMRFKEAHERRNIVGHFAQDMPTYGDMAHIIPHPEDTGSDLFYAQSWYEQLNQFPYKDYGIIETDLVFTKMPNKDGDCGTVYVHVPTQKIVGIHLGGQEKSMIGHAVRWFAPELEEKREGYVVEEPIKLEAATVPFIPGIVIEGKLPPGRGSYIPEETKFERSWFDIDSFPLPETKDGPAHLKKEGDRSPLVIAFSAFGKQSCVPGDEPLEVLTDFLPPQFDRSKLRVLTVWEAIFGIPQYLKSLDRSTSSGYVYKRLGLPRQKLWGFVEMDTPCQGAVIQEGMWIHPVLFRDIEQRLVKLKAKIVTPMIFECVLKDEIRSEAKVSAFLTRLFDSGDIAGLIIQRMYLGAFFAEATKDPTRSPIGLGINPHSKEWGELWSYLRRGGLNSEVLAGDFSYFDISLKHTFMKDFVRLVNLLSWDPLVEYVLMANVFGIHICGSLVFTRPWGTDSGTFITAIYNTFANWNAHKRAFRALYGTERWPEVRSTFTGDDSALTVPSTLRDYNMEYLRHYFWETYRMTYTSPLKTENLSMTWEDLTYLKRKFVLGHAGMMAPLAERSIANMVKWSFGPPTVEVMGSICQSVLLEAWHYGEERYQKFLDWTVKESKRFNGNWTLLDWQGMRLARKDDY
jgi:hypothetical protein